MSNKAVDQYLQRYAEAETAFAADIVEQAQTRSPSLFQHCVVIPCYGESDDFIQRWQHSTLAKNNLLIIVINAHEKTTAHDQDKNMALWQQLTGDSSPCVWKLFQTASSNIVVINRFTEQRTLNSKEGVGHARKIGCDVAVALIKAGLVTCPWIYSTDADAHLPENYFSSSNCNQNNYSAQVFNFEHRQLYTGKNESAEFSESGFTSTEIQLATQSYETQLRYYKEGLKWARSPYAFYTLGSTLAINYIRYCQVRGFPKRAGAEDFYLLNKAAKLASVFSNGAITVYLQARLSHRVPFGTGPAVEKLLTDEAALNYYHPHCFMALGIVLFAVQQLIAKLPHFTAGTTQPSQWQTLLQSLLAPYNINPKNCAGMISALQMLKFEQCLQHIGKQCKTPEAALQHFHHWFDAFATLKFIRFMQQHHFPAVPINVAVAQLGNWQENPEVMQLVATNF